MPIKNPVALYEELQNAMFFLTTGVLIDASHLAGKNTLEKIAGEWGAYIPEDALAKTPGPRSAPATKGTRPLKEDEKIDILTLLLPTIAGFVNNLEANFNPDFAFMLVVARRLHAVFDAINANDLQTEAKPQPLLVANLTVIQSRLAQVIRQYEAFHTFLDPAYDLEMAARKEEKNYWRRSMIEGSELTATILAIDSRPRPRCTDAHKATLATAAAPADVEGDSAKRTAARLSTASAGTFAHGEERTPLLDRAPSETCCGCSLQ